MTGRVFLDSEAWWAAEPPDVPHPADPWADTPGPPVDAYPGYRAAHYDPMTTTRRQEPTP